MNRNEKPGLAEKLHDRDFLVDCFLEAVVILCVIGYLAICIKACAVMFP